MITINNKEYRNIVEQVEKNKEDIARHYARDRVLAEVGIKVMGQLENQPADDQLPPGGTEAYGEAYLVGATEPYDIYIWTRPGKWFNIGPLNMIGDQGPAGDSIDKAEVTTDNRLKLTMSDGREVITTAAFTTIKGDTGDIGPANSITGFTIDPITYRATLIFEDGSSATSSISIQGRQGEQGEQGIQGPQGIPGLFYYIRGIVPTIGELTEIPITDMRFAYLVGTTSPYLMYIPVGESTLDAEWKYVGGFNTASVITVNGVAQTQYEMNNKISVAEPKTGYQAYIQPPNSTNVVTQLLRPSINPADKYQFVIRDVIGNVNSGQIQVPETPNQPYHAASKAYVDKFAAQIGVKYYQHNIQIQISNEIIIYLTQISGKETPYNQGSITTLPYGIIMSCTGRDYNEAIIAYQSVGSEGLIYTKQNGEEIFVDFYSGDYNVNVLDQVFRIN